MSSTNIRFRDHEENRKLIKQIRYRFKMLCDETVGSCDYNINIASKADELIRYLNELKGRIRGVRESDEELKARIAASHSRLCDQR